MKDWNIDLSNHSLSVNGEQLAAPEVEFGSGPVPKSADWSRATKDARLIEGKDLLNWILVYTSRDKNNAYDLVNNVKKVGEPIGMRVRDPIFIALRSDHLEDYKEEIRRNITKDTQMVVCIIPTTKKDRYDAIKLLCCKEIGIPSQCVVGKTLSKKQNQLSVCSKIIQQINCKLGGQLWRVRNTPPKSMVIGIDVNHDNSRKQGRRSVAGFCASTNDSFTKYYSDTSFQAVGQELVDGLKSFMSKALEEYNKINLTLPHWIFIYRDGVGDGMLPAVVCRKYKINNYNNDY